MVSPMGEGGGMGVWAIKHLDAAVAVLWTFPAWCGVYFLAAVRRGAGGPTEAVAADAQNRMLRYQLDPQFLFNIHRALSALIYKNRNADAEHLVLTSIALPAPLAGKRPRARVRASR